MEEAGNMKEAGNSSYQLHPRHCKFGILEYDADGGIRNSKMRLFTVMLTRTGHARTRTRTKPTRTRQGQGLDLQGQGQGQGQGLDLQGQGQGLKFGP